MKLEAPQLIYLACVFLSLGITMAQHGKPKMGNHSVFSVLFGCGIQIALMYWGGFFTK